MSSSVPCNAIRSVFTRLYAFANNIPSILQCTYYSCKTFLNEQPPMTVLIYLIRFCRKGSSRIFLRRLRSLVSADWWKLCANQSAERKLRKRHRSILLSPIVPYSHDERIVNRRRCLCGHCRDGRLKQNMPRCVKIIFQLFQILKN